MLTSATRGEPGGGGRCPNEFSFTLTTVIKGYLYYIQYIWDPRRAETAFEKSTFCKGLYGENDGPSI